MKKKSYAIIKLIVFLVILLTCLVMIHNITKRKYAYQKTEDFFSQEEDFDVLFFGSSHMVNGMLPMQLWKDYGIVSYNMGNHSEYMESTYYNMLLALEETHPKLIVVDTFNMYRYEEIDNSGSFHKTLDAYPLSYKKFLVVKELFKGKDLLSNEMEYLFNFSMYHARWSELVEEDFKNSNTYEKGAESKTSIVSQNRMNNFNSIIAYDKEETDDMQYLRKIIEYCEKNDIKILLTYLPYSASDRNIAISKYVQNICDEYNVNYINFLNMDLVNYNIDFFDKYAHLNVSGARKVTDYIGKYIIENYDIEDQRKNKLYEFWNEDYNEYIDLKIRNLKANEKNLNNYLMLLYGEQDIKYEIKISSKKEIDGILQKLLSNIGNNYQIDDTDFEENQNKTVKITTYDNRNGNLIRTVWF